VQVYTIEFPKIAIMFNISPKNLDVLIFEGSTQSFTEASDAF
jgi:hypothetical protein